MSQEAVQQIIGKAVTDEKFRALLLSNPDEALADFDLTDEEKETLRNLDVEQIGGVERELDQRITKVSKLHL